MMKMKMTIIHEDAECTDCGSDLVLDTKHPDALEDAGIFGIAVYPECSEEEDV